MRNEYLVAENRILKAQLKTRLQLTDAIRPILRPIFADFRPGHEITRGIRQTTDNRLQQIGSGGTCHNGGGGTSARADNRELHGFSDGMVAIRHVEFVVNVFGVTFYSRRRDRKLVCNLSVAQLVREQLQDFTFSLRQGGASAASALVCSSPWHAARICPT